MSLILYIPKICNLFRWNAHKDRVPGLDLNPFRKETFLQSLNGH